MQQASILVASWGGTALHAAEAELPKAYRRVQGLRDALRASVLERGGQCWSADDLCLVATFPSPLDALMVACDGAVHGSVGLCRGPVVDGSCFGPGLERARRMSLLGGHGLLVAQELLAAVDLPDGLGSFRVGEALEALIGHPTLAVRDYREATV